MIQTRIDRLTGLPWVREDRSPVVPTTATHCTCAGRRCQWHALPRQPFGTVVHAVQQSGLWTPAYQTWEGPRHTRIRCWKCGRDLWSWRQALTPTGKPGEGQAIEVNGQPAVAFLPLHHYRQQRWAVRLPRLQETVTFDALLCADCDIDASHGEAVVACYLAGLYASYRHATDWHATAGQMPRLSPDAVASYFYRWGGADPLGPVPRTQTDPFWRA